MIKTLKLLVIKVRGPVSEVGLEIKQHWDKAISDKAISDKAISDKAAFLPTVNSRGIHTDSIVAK